MCISVYVWVRGMTVSVYIVYIHTSIKQPLEGYAYYKVAFQESCLHHTCIKTVHQWCIVFIIWHIRLLLNLFTHTAVVRAFAHGAMGRGIDPSWGGPIELFLVPASAPELVKQRLWYVLSCLWDGAYKRTLAVNQKELSMWQQWVSCILSEWSFTKCLTPYNHK